MFCQKPFPNNVFLEGIPVLGLLEICFTVMTSAVLGVSYHTRTRTHPDTRTLTLLERLQHVNSAELRRKAKVCGYEFDQQAGKWFLMFALFWGRGSPFVPFIRQINFTERTEKRLRLDSVQQQGQSHYQTQDIKP